jgi:dTDP-4-dehydrorhamnose reductase
MKILLLGRDGQVGWELQRALAPLGEMIALGRSHNNGYCGDLRDHRALQETLHLLRPTVIVNAAAYTAVDKAEENRELAHVVNAEAPTVLAETAYQLGALLVHYSTDYVFSGEGKTPWRETDKTGPVNFYGASKLAGEQGIAQSGCHHMIFRTSWVYASRGNNFLLTMARLMKEREQLNIVNDQIGAPTSAELIADVTAHALRARRRGSRHNGIYHLTASGETSWQGYARYICETLTALGVEVKATPENIGGIATREYPTPASRPLNSRLNTTKLRDTFNLALPHWKTGVRLALTEYVGTQGVL